MARSTVFPTTRFGPPGGIQPDELPEPMREGRPTSVEAADKALVRKPQIGDTRPAPPRPSGATADPVRRARRYQHVEPQRIASPEAADQRSRRAARAAPTGSAEERRRGGRIKHETFEIDPDVLEQRRGRERNGARSVAT